jgi:hypothetical protein
MSNVEPWRPGDVANNHVLGADGAWHPFHPTAPPPVTVRMEGGSADSALAPVTSIWCGGGALLVSWIPVLGMVAWLLAPLGLVFGLIGLRRGKTEHKVMSWLGIVASGLALLICVAWLVVFAKAVGDQ